MAGLQLFFAQKILLYYIRYSSLKELNIFLIQGVFMPLTRLDEMKRGEGK